MEPYPIMFLDFMLIFGVYATAVGFDRGCRVMNSFVHSLPMLLGPFKNAVGNPNFVFEGKTIQRMELLVLITLKWRMLAYTPCTYIDYFVHAIACSYETYKAKLLRHKDAMNHLVPQDELAQAGLSDEDIFAGRVTDEWRIFMKKQIQRARKFFYEA
ncbi:hypothetical protein H5410_019644 [Solanum commersonii]|uniref:Uncharacterized protein n=1 Tax=Solanum commersonii TaxID=4109 RepID=A0A9J5Z5T9_SOLCO|nr:hypothetical protein H5410_019644 [Solanum commersonii]